VSRVLTRSVGFNPSPARVAQTTVDVTSEHLRPRPALAAVSGSCCFVHSVITTLACRSGTLQRSVDSSHNSYSNSSDTMHSEISARYAIAVHWLHDRAISPEIMAAAHTMLALGFLLQPIATPRVRTPETAISIR
jgi:hypothetical protein